MSERRTGRYRHLDESTNSKCDKCKIPIWRRLGVHTISHGHSYYSNNLKKKTPESVVVWDGKTPEVSIVCHKCFKKIDKEMKREK